MCSKQVIDVFGTSDREVERFIGNILTVDVQEVTAGDCAVVTNSKTPWIMPWINSATFNLEVGQQIRIGAGSVTDHSDYITVLEKRPVQRVASGIVHTDADGVLIDDGTVVGTVVGVYSTNVGGGGTVTHTITISNSTAANVLVDDVLSKPAVLSPPSDAVTWTVTVVSGSSLTVSLTSGAAPSGSTPFTYTVTRPKTRGQPLVYYNTGVPTYQAMELPIGLVAPTNDNWSESSGNTTVNAPYAWSDLVHFENPNYAYRLSISHDWTSVKPVPPNYNFLQSRMQRMDLLENRHTISTGPSTLSDWERYLYPVYTRSSNVQQIKIELDRGVKSVEWIKLCGYAIHHLHHAGEVHGSDAEITEWLGLRVKEIDGTVVSNNPHANGSLCILNAGGHAYRPVGVGQAIEYYQNDPQGLHTHVFKTPDTTLRALTCEVVDKDGYRVNSARMHLWFKMCVTHG